MNAAMLAVLIVSQAGLATKDLAKGTGVSAKSGDVLTVDYVGKLKDGTEFDATTDKPPFAFRLGEGKVIRGWDVGLLGMKTGGVRKLYIPPVMGYGDKKMGSIPAGSTLVFEVRLLRIDPANAKPKIEVQELASGSGPGVKSGDTVTVHYIGTFVNGVKFDASYDRNEPFKVTTGAKKVIPGFDQGLMGLKVGGKRKVTIPYALAYGEKGRTPVIPAMATLVFELELLKIE